MTGGQASTAHLTARFLRMLSIALEELDAVRDATRRAEYAGLTVRAGRLERETNVLEREMEDACLAAFAGPLTPGELAFHLLVFRSLTNLERVGDYAFGVARDLEALAPRTRSATLQDVLPLVDVAVGADPMAVTREGLSRYLLGPHRQDPMQDFVDEVAAFVARTPSPRIDRLEEAR